jgi:hypothetical protein
VPALTPGPYRLAAELSGFKKLTRENIVLLAGITQTLDVKLEVGALEETITVSGQTAQVDLTSAEVGGRVSLAEVQAIPSISHNMMGYLQVVPGIQYTPGAAKPSTESVTVNGQSAGVSYYLDGGLNSSSVFPGGSVGQRVMASAEVIQEVVATTTQLPAEYGGRSGAVINAITKQGTNALRGSVYGFFGNDSLTAPNYFVVLNNLPRLPFNKGEGGASLGGPLVRDKLFFMGLVEYTYKGQDTAYSYPTVPSQSFTTNAVVRGVNAFVRVDHQIDANNAYAVRFMVRDSGCSGDPGCAAGGVGTSIATNNPTATAVQQEWEFDTVVVANYNRVISSTKLNSVIFSFPRQTIQTGVPSNSPDALSSCVSCLPPTLRYLSFDAQQTYFDHQRWEPTYRLEDSFNWLRGRHDLKFGGFMTYARHKQINYDDDNGIFTFVSNTPFNAAVPSTYPELLTIRNGAQTSDPRMATLASYAQDKWRLTDRLTLNFGLRYDVVLAQTPNQFNPLFADRNSYPIDWGGVGPRLSAAYASSDGKAVVRGGWSQVFQQPYFNPDIDPYWRQGVYGTGLVVNFPSGGSVDPGPAAGQLPSSPFLVNGPVVNAGLLNLLFPAGTPFRNPSVVYIDNPDRKLPRSRQATVGYQREFATNLAAAVDYMHTWGSKDLIAYDLNPGLRASTGRTAAITRTDFMGIASSLGLSPFSTDVYTYENIGRDSYDGLNLSLEKRFSQFWSARVSYTLARPYNDATQANFQVLNVSNPQEAWGPAGRTHVLNVSGRLELPRTGGLGVSGTFYYMSGLPLSLINSNVDTDRNGILADLLPAGTYSGSGLNALTVQNSGTAGGAVGPAFHQLDMRLDYRFRLGGKRTFQLNADVFNVTNAVNFSNPSGDMRQPTFLVPTALVSNGIPRQLQVSMRLGF